MELGMGFLNGVVLGLLSLHIFFLLQEELSRYRFLLFFEIQYLHLNL